MGPRAYRQSQWQAFLRGHPAVARPVVRSLCVEQPLSTVLLSRKGARCAVLCAYVFVHMCCECACVCVRVCVRANIALSKHRDRQTARQTDRRTQAGPPT